MDGKILKCPLNGAPCRGKEECKLWIDYTDFQGCVFQASEEILNRIGVEIKGFLKTPLGKTILSVAGSLLSRDVPDIRTRTRPDSNDNLPVPTKSKPR